MNIINGSEDTSKFSEEEKALSDFYMAFNNSNMEKMQSNWSTGHAPVMSNPLGGKKNGWEEIQQVYEQIFNGPAKVFVEFYDYYIHSSEQMFSAAGREQGYLLINDNKIDLDIRTSRVFQRESGLWKQVHHHGSIDNPELLQTYQQAVLLQDKYFDGSVEF